MLKVDLRQLERKRRLTIDAAIGPDDPFWRNTGVELGEPLRVQLDAQLAGRDVIVQGELTSRTTMPCRRCLRPVTVELKEKVALVYRPGLTRVEAEAQEVFPLPERSDELNLADALREQVVLAVPQYAMCGESCRGLCPQCGTNLNEAQCDCAVTEEDPRWAALRKHRID